jgi:hypothetical protein
MADVEIPLLKESVAYAARLARAARALGETRYTTHRRINWSHRYADDFYAAEAAIFLRDCDRYLAGELAGSAPLEDVFCKPLTSSALTAITVKVIAHRAFALAGMLQARLPGALRAKTYRKCYVDDIELVFEPDAPDTLRAVYPFPLSVRRQIRYLQRLRQERRRFRFAGHRYFLVDLLRLWWRRDLRSLMRLEARAQLAHAREIAKWGFSRVEMSDEFNLGSLEFARILDRLGIETINSAHGVGKYLPVHAYREFITLTKVQQRYYIAALPCRYKIGALNDRSPASGPTHLAAGRVQLVLLSQTFPGLTGMVRENEIDIIESLAQEFAMHPAVELLFKPHPTQGDRAPPSGFDRLDSLAAVNGRPGTLFVSQFSTCQIDPNFKGRKVLVRGRLVYPEIAFDEGEPIMTIDELVASIKAMAGTETVFLEQPSNV